VLRNHLRLFDKRETCYMLERGYEDRFLTWSLSQLPVRILK